MIKLLYIFIMFCFCAFCQLNADAKEKWRIVSDTNTYNYYPNYIKKPYHNPNLVKEIIESKKEEIIKAKRQYESAIQINEEELSSTCANFYSSKRSQGFYYFQNFYYDTFYDYKVNNYKIYPRKIYNFKKFKTSCEKFYKNNKLIKSAEMY